LREKVVAGWRPDEGYREASSCCDASKPDFEPLTLSVVAGLLRKTPHPAFADAKATFSRKGRRSARPLATPNTLAARRHQPYKSLISSGCPKPSAAGAERGWRASFTVNPPNLIRVMPAEESR
jgi:hypothetical protein